MTIDKDLLKLAEFYGIEITEGNGSVIIMPDGKINIEYKINDYKLVDSKSILDV